MEARINFTSATLSEADALFDRIFRFKLEDFLRNECILDPSGVERVISQARIIYIRTCYKVDCSLLLKAQPEPKYADHAQPILDYVQTYGPGVCESFVQSLKSLRYTMLQETCRQLAHLDEKHIKRRIN